MCATTTTPTPTIPTTFTNPVVIIIPDTAIPDPTSAAPTGWDSSVKATLYYVPNNTGTPICLVNENGGITSAAIQLRCKIHPRGDATLNMPKQQFEVELESEPVSGHFLGMNGGGRKWVFNDCGAFDYTLVRNVLTFHLQRQMGQYAPEYKFFELFLCQNTASPNDMNTLLQTYYHGLYLNFDKIKFSKSRVNLPYDESNLTSDYAILQMNQSSDKYYALQSLVLTEQALVYEPDLKAINNATNPSDIETDFDSWYYDSSNPNNTWAGFYGNIYNTYILNQKTVSIPSSIWATQTYPTDYLSYATYFILNELARDPDGYHKSTFFVKAKNTCKAGPLWDKNKSYGNIALRGATDPYVSPDGWLFAIAGQTPVWWQVLVYDPKFCQAVYDLWMSNTVMSSLLTYNSINAFITGEVNQILMNGSLGRDSARWPNQYNSSGGEFSNANYSVQVNQMFNYIEQRLTWMGANLLPLLEQSGWTPPD